MNILPKKGGSNSSEAPPDKKGQWTLGHWWKKTKLPGTNNSSKDQSQSTNDEDSSRGTPKGVEKIGNYAKNFLKGIAANINTQLMNPVVLGDPTWGDFGQKLEETEEEKSNRKQKVEEDDSSDDDIEEDDDEEQTKDRKNGDDQEDSDGSASGGYEEEEGSLEEDEEEEDDDEEETPKPDETPGGPSDNDNFVIDHNFAIDDDESPPIKHSPVPDAADEIIEDKQASKVQKDKKKKKKKKVSKTEDKDPAKKKSKSKKKKRRVEKQNEELVLEEVYTNKRYTFGALFTNFHQFYFKGDYLEFDKDDFFQVSIINEKSGLTNMLFKETHYINIQDDIFYLTKLEKVDNAELAFVLESYPLTRLVRLDKVEKKKRVNISFYTDESAQNLQREMSFEVKKFSKFIKAMDEYLSTINSSFNILRFNIE